MKHLSILVVCLLVFSAGTAAAYPTGDPGIIVWPPGGGGGGGSLPPSPPADDGFYTVLCPLVAIVDVYTSSSYGIRTSSDLGIKTRYGPSAQVRGVQIWTPTGDKEILITRYYASQLYDFDGYRYGWPEQPLPWHFPNASLYCVHAVAYISSASATVPAKLQVKVNKTVTPSDEAASFSINASSTYTRYAVNLSAYRNYIAAEVLDPSFYVMFEIDMTDVATINTPVIVNIDYVGLEYRWAWNYTVTFTEPRVPLSVNWLPGFIGFGALVMLIALPAMAIVFSHGASDNWNRFWVIMKYFFAWIFCFGMFLYVID